MGNLPKILIKFNFNFSFAIVSAKRPADVYLAMNGTSLVAHASVKMRKAANPRAANEI